jgi:hypothetical protein
VFCGRDEGAAAVGDVLEVLQLEEGKARREPMGRKREQGTSLTVGGRSGSGSTGAGTGSLVAELDNRSWWGCKGGWNALVVSIQERGMRRSPSRSRDEKKEGAGARHGVLEKRGKGGGGSVTPRGGEGGVRCRMGHDHSVGRRGVADQGRWGEGGEFKLIQNLIQTN